MNTKVAKKNNKGFTLIELIVVIAIIAVLAAILAPQYLRYVEKSRVSSDQQYANELKNAVKTSLSEEDAAQDIAADSSVKWDKTSGIVVKSKTGSTTWATNTQISVGSSTGFTKELATNLSGETVTAPKSRVYSAKVYTISFTVANDAIAVTGAWN